MPTSDCLVSNDRRSVRTRAALRLALAQEIDEVIKHLDEYRKAIRAGDREELTILLRDGRERKERLG